MHFARIAAAISLLMPGLSTKDASYARPTPMAADGETRYLAFQIFTNYSNNPAVASLLSNGMREPLTPGNQALLNYVNDIKQRIGTVGTGSSRLAVMLGPLCFEQTDAEISQYISNAFEMALQTNVAIGFHIDDSIFWANRKDLLTDPNNLETADWDAPPSAGRRLDWSKTPTQAPPQMCFNSPAIQRAVRRRSMVIGRAIVAGTALLAQRKHPELFAGVIVGWETMIGQEFSTGKYLGYRALQNRGFSREHPPRDMNLERESIVKEFIDRWTAGIAVTGVSPQSIYSHTAFLSHRSFELGADKSVTYMQRAKNSAYSQHNHFAPPSVAFGDNHRAGFSTYPQPGLFEEIYSELAKHQQVHWASSEGTNMQPESGPGQSGMNMETYLARMFNHGATVVNVFAWGLGGDAMKTMNFRLVTEGAEAIAAYRKFLSGTPLTEVMGDASIVQERLPKKIHKIQNELPTWVQKTGSPERAAEATALMKRLQHCIETSSFDEAEKTADEIIKMMQKGAQLR